MSTSGKVWWACVECDNKYDPKCRPPKCMEDDCEGELRPVLSGSEFLNKVLIDTIKDEIARLQNIFNKEKSSWFPNTRMLNHYNGRIYSYEEMLDALETYVRGDL